MELSELAQIRLVTIGIVLIFVAIWTAASSAAGGGKPTSRLSGGRSEAR